LTVNFVFEAGFWGLPFGFYRKEFTELPTVFRGILKDHRLEPARIKFAISSKRFGFLLEELPDAQTEMVSEIRGPKASISFDLNNQPMPAAIGFANKLGIEIKDLFFREIDGEKYVFGKKKEVGETFQKCLPALLEKLLKSIPWNADPWKESAFFPHPPFCICAVLDQKPFAIQIDGIKSGDVVFFPPERFEKITSAKDYFKILAEAKIQPLPQDRQKIIESSLQVVSGEGLTVRKESSLLEKIAFEFENPHPFVVTLPPETLTFPSGIFLKALADSPCFLPFESTKGGVISKFAGFVEGENPPEDLGLRTENLMIRLTIRKEAWKRDVEKSMEERTRELRFLPGTEGKTAFDLALEISRTAQAVSQSLNSGISSDVLDPIIRVFLSETSCDLCLIHPELRGNLISELAIAQGLSPTTVAALKDCENLVNETEVLPASPEGTILCLAFLLQRICFEENLTLPQRQDSADKAIWLILGKKIQLDLLAIPPKIGKKCLVGKDFWIESLFRKIGKEGFDRKKFDWVFAKESFNPVWIVETMEKWRKGTPPDIENLLSIFERIKTKISPGDIPTENFLAPSAAVEIALDKKLIDIEMKDDDKIEDILTMLLECRVEMEACLMDLPPVCDDSNPQHKTRLALLLRAMKQIQRLPFVSHKAQITSSIQISHSQQGEKKDDDSRG